MIRLCAALLIFAGCLGIGVLEGVRKQRNLTVLRDMLFAIQVVEREMDLNARPMPDALLMAAEQCGNSQIKNMLLNCAVSAEQGKDFTGDLAEFTDHIGMRKDQRDILASLFDLLGRYDIQGQLTAIERTCRQLFGQLESERGEVGAKCRLCSGLGAAVGGALAVLLV